MKIKLAIIYGILSWVLIYILSTILNPIFTDNVPYINLIVPISIIVVTGFFGILYIRHIEEREVIEGIVLGIIFVLIDMICDYLFFIIPNNKPLILENYPLHVISMIILTLLITTFLGYLAQMNIDLK